MVEQGFVQLVQTGLAALSPAVVVPGGYAVELPKDIMTANAAAWCYHSIISVPLYTISTQVSFTVWHVQVDCHGQTPANAIVLARAIDSVLRGLTGITLPDPDNTKVDSIIREPHFVDGFSDTNRTFVRTLEYRVQYYQS